MSRIDNANPISELKFLDEVTMLTPGSESSITWLIIILEVVLPILQVIPIIYGLLPLR